MHDICIQVKLTVIVHCRLLSSRGIKVDPKTGLFTREDNSSQDAQWVSCTSVEGVSLVISISDVCETEHLSDVI